MEYENFNIGDRVAYHVNGKRITGTVVNIDKYEMYEIEFDDKDYLNVLTDNEKIYKLEE